MKGIRWKHQAGPDLLAALVYLLLLVFEFRKVLIPGIRGATALGYDVINEYWPDFSFRFLALSKGEWPFWNPYDSGGISFSASSQNMLFYPPSWLLWCFHDSSSGLGFRAFQVFVLLHLVVLALGAHVLARRFCRAELSCYLAGTTLLLGAPLLVHKASAFLWPLAWLPWLLAACLALCERPCLRSSGRLALFAALLVSAACPPGVFNAFLAVALVAMTLAATFVFRSAGSTPPDLKRVIGFLLLACLPPLLVSVPAYLPNLELLPDVARKTGGASYVFDRSLLPADLSSVFMPLSKDRWWFRLFLGTAFPALLLVGLLNRPSRVKAAFFLAAAVLVLLALGRDGVLLPLLHERIPVFGLFRKAYRYALPGLILLAPVAAAGFDALFFRSERRDSFVLPVFILVLVYVVTVGLRLSHESTASFFDQGGLRLFVAFSALCLAASIVPRFVVTRSAALVSAVVFLAASGYQNHLAAADILENLGPPRLGSEKKVLAWASKTRRDFRLWPARGLRLGAGSRHLARLADGYRHPMAFDRHRRFMDWAGLNPARLGLINVKYMSTCRTPKKGADAAGKCRWTIPKASAAAELYGGAAMVDSYRETLRNFSKLRARGVLPIEGADWSPILEPYAGKTGKVTPFKYRKMGINWIALKTEAPQGGLLLLNETWHRWWRVRVDGQPAPLFRGAGIFIGVPLSPGKHSVLLDYSIPGYGLMAAAGVLGFLLALLMLASPGVSASSVTSLQHRGALAVSWLWQRAARRR